MADKKLGNAGHLHVTISQDYAEDRRAEEVLRQEIVRKRGRLVNEFLRKQAGFAISDARRWHSLTEIAEEYARRHGSLKDDDYRWALHALRCSIRAGEFFGLRGSRVLNLHPSPLATFRFDPPGASNPEQFDLIATHLRISHRDCMAWCSRHLPAGDVPQRLQPTLSSGELQGFARPAVPNEKIVAPDATAETEPAMLAKRLLWAPASTLQEALDSVLKSARSENEARGIPIPSIDELCGKMLEVLKETGHKWPRESQKGPDGKVDPNGRVGMRDMIKARIGVQKRGSAPRAIRTRKK